MSYSTMRHWLAGGAMIVAVASMAHAQEDPKVAFEARYAEMTGAMLAKDGTKLGAMLAPEFESTDIRGETHTRANMIENLAKMPPEMAEMKPVIKVLSVKQSGDTASVENQMTMQIKRPDDNGQEITLEIAMTGADTWVQRGGAWLLQKSVQKEMTVSKDGEVVFKQAN
ncbi:MULTISPECIES: nuclear transport factor 2 family protein [unclassified Novosphingobium]|uniref:nuclear transport factor 2 family protein n=1 Tax=unclassified Novosphingobium TaxID=2644732 RepID=UPI0025DCB0FE|nr:MULTISPECIES: nuclear transport factor 2 family protein [unclassified Novosphingobium]HQV03100.1 nuclear transport factor 2 family protein [Novosphingobium sp.]